MIIIVRKHKQIKSNEIKGILQYIYKYDRESFFYRFKVNIRLIRLWWLGQKEPVSN